MSAPGPARRWTDRGDWETPAALFDPLNREFGFTLDAAASAVNRKAERWLSGPCSAPEPCSCGLCADWIEHVVWCNPPYGSASLGRWVPKFAEAAHGGATIVALLPSNTDTAWFGDIWCEASEIRFLRGRVNFVGSSSGNTGGNLVAVYRPQPKGLTAALPLVSLWNWRAAS